MNEYEIFKLNYKLDKIMQCFNQANMWSEDEIKEAFEKGKRNAEQKEIEKKIIIML